LYPLNSPVSVVITDQRLTIEYVNTGFEKATGYLFDEVHGKNLSILVIDTEHRDMIKRAVEHSLLGQSWQGQVKYQTKDGVTRVLDVVTSAIFNSGDQVTNFVAVSRDITYELELQSQLVNAQKLKALGRLSASIAHDFGNPLIGIRALLKDFDQRLELNQQDTHLLEIAVSECNRMQTLIGNFQHFYNSKRTFSTPCDINEVLNRLVFFMQKTLLTNNITTVIDHTPNLPPTKGRVDQLEQVFLNIILNAVDAMADQGGTLTIATYSEKDSICAAISDTGQGMDEQTMRQIFEPFYSTKPEVDGTGLGLSVSYGIISAHNGTITCRSTVSEGTTFKVFLPVEAHTV
ncbi:MAG: PAS domain S-box protein, partial [Deltaproteobacteria bacterium]|nr:PAS domain S-box protein [Deltaproteobacteria bacterium]